MKRTFRKLKNKVMRPIKTRQHYKKLLKEHKQGIAVNRYEEQKNLVDIITAYTGKMESAGKQINPMVGDYEQINEEMKSLKEVNQAIDLAFKEKLRYKNYKIWIGILFASFTTAVVGPVVVGPAEVELAAKWFLIIPIIILVVILANLLASLRVKPKEIAIPGLMDNAEAIQNKTPLRLLFDMREKHLETITKDTDKWMKFIRKDLSVTKETSLNTIREKIAELDKFDWANGTDEKIENFIGSNFK